VACNTTKKKPVAKTNATATDSITVKLELITNAADLPVELKSSPDSTHRIFITDNRGKILILEKDSVLPKPFFNIYDKLGNQDKNSSIGAVFSFAFHPQFSTNGKFYVCYNSPTKIHGNTCKMVVSEFTRSKSDPDVADLRSERSVLELEGKNVQTNGAQISFGPDGFLYISIGDDKGSDSAYQYHAQDLGFLNGKLLRIDVNHLPYTIPRDNPFVGVKNARPEIWAYGFRKLWHYEFDPVTHQLVGGDVGEDKDEEVDIVKKGANYGWPVMEGDSVFQKAAVKNKSAYTAPVSTYAHNEGICIIGGAYYYGNEITGLKNKYVFGDFNGSMFALAKNAHGEWIRQPLKIFNKPADPFLICGCNIDDKNNLFVMGILNGKSGAKGAVYKIVRI
jgi:glucose/arabinose dehydrogenase